MMLQFEKKNKLVVFWYIPLIGVIILFTEALHGFAIPVPSWTAPRLFNNNCFYFSNNKTKSLLTYDLIHGLHFVFD